MFNGKLKAYISTAGEQKLRSGSRSKIQGVRRLEQR